MSICTFDIPGLGVVTFLRAVSDPDKEETVQTAWCTEPVTDIMLAQMNRAALDIGGLFGARRTSFPGLSFVLILSEYPASETKIHKILEMFVEKMEFYTKRGTRVPDPSTAMAVNSPVSAFGHYGG